MTRTKLDNEKLELHKKHNRDAHKEASGGCCRKGQERRGGYPTAERGPPDGAACSEAENRDPRGSPRRQRRLLPAQLTHNPPSHTHCRTGAAAAADHLDRRQPHLEHQPPAPNRHRFCQEPTPTGHTRDRPDPNPTTHTQPAFPHTHRRTEPLPPPTTTMDASPASNTLRRLRTTAEIARSRRLLSTREAAPTPTHPYPPGQTTALTATRHKEHLEDRDVPCLTRVPRVHVAPSKHVPAESADSRPTRVRNGPGSPTNFAHYNSNKVAPTQPRHTNTTRIEHKQQIPRPKRPPAPHPILSDFKRSDASSSEGEPCSTSRGWLVAWVINVP